jgi:hypothetical protein
MRSDQIHRVLSHGINRFEVCSLVSKGVRRTHKTGARFEDSINDVLQYLGSHDSDPDNMHSSAEIATAKKMRPAA